MIRCQVYPGYFGTMWYWRLKAKNGKIVADGCEAYLTRANAVLAFRNNISLGLDTRAPIRTEILNRRGKVVEFFPA